LDLITTSIDALSVAVLVFLVFVGSKAIRAFRESKQAVVESGSLLNVIVTALTSRVEASESLVSDLRTQFKDVSERSAEVEREHIELRDAYHRALYYLQEILVNDRKLIIELEQLKRRMDSERRAGTGKIRGPEEGTPLPEPGNDILATLTPTERHTLEILSREGPKVAPELGRRMRKSREHMARLMKKLYFEGYVDRESNHAPFRYKLSERVQTILKASRNEVTGEVQEKV
jgi:hypothetical protein